VNPHLEAAADELLRQDLKGVNSHTAKKDILTPWKEKDRRRREIYSKRGYADASQRQGLYNRAANKTSPHLNGRDGKVTPLGRTYQELDLASDEHLGEGMPPDFANFLRQM
jgi:hypothetical protein